MEGIIKPLLTHPQLVLPGELPDDERLVPGGRENHLGELGVGGDLCGPGLLRDRDFTSHTYCIYINARIN